jgi:hypothetical protein
MQWEVWDIESGNLVGWRETEEDGLLLVADLVSKGWPIDVLALSAEDEARPDDALAPALTGAALKQRADLVVSEHRRSA